MPDMNMQTTYPVANLENEYKGGCMWRDDLRNRFSCASVFRRADNNNTWLELEKRDPAGAVVGNWRILLPAGWKTTGNPFYDNDGTTLIVGSAIYQYSVASNRPSVLGYVEIPGVFGTGSTPPPPPPTTGDLVITSPAAVVGTWRRVSSGFDRALQEMEQDAAFFQTEEAPEGG